MSVTSAASSAAGTKKEEEQRGRMSLIGIGMGSAEDITLRGLQFCKEADFIFLEHYTAILIDDKDTTRLQELIGKPVVLADREAVESGAVIEPAVEKQKHVCVLVVGDPLSATTHSDLIERCTSKNVSVDVVSNASIFTAVGCVGLQLYRYGQALSLCFWTEGWRPAGFFDRLAANRALGIHTLLLLDIKVKEISDANLAKGKKIYEPPRFMSASYAARQLLDIESARKISGVALGHHIVIAVARLGSETSLVIVTRLQDLAKCPDELLGAPLHSVVFPGEIHECESDYVLLSKQLIVGKKSGNLEIVDPLKTTKEEEPELIGREELKKTKIGAAEKKAILLALAEEEMQV